MFSTGVVLVILRNNLLSADALSCLSFVLLFLPVRVSRVVGVDLGVSSPCQAPGSSRVLQRVVVLLYVSNCQACL